MDLLRKDVSSYRQNVEKEFYEALEKFLWVNQIFCAAPIRIGFLVSSSKENLIEKVSSAGHLLYGFVICGCVCFATYLQKEEFDSSMGFLTRVLYMGEYLVGAFNLLLVIIGCQYQRRFYRVFFKRLVNVDINLQKCGFQPNFDATRAFLNKALIAYGFFFASVIVVDFMYNKMGGDSFVRSSTVYTVPNLVSTLALTQYSTVNVLIRDKLKTINEALKMMASGNEFQDHLQTANGKLNVISVLSLNIGINKSHCVKTLRRQHGELSRLIDLLNKCFGLLIVLVLVAAYVILSIQFYQIYKISEGFETQNIWLLLYTILWIILHGGKVLIVLYPVHDILDEQKRTGNLIFDMDVKDRKVIDDDVAAQLKMFADQLLHERSPPNALRIINLDLNLVGTMVGTLTTYLIILIQFDASAREQTVKV